VLWGAGKILRSTCSENVPVGSALADAFAGPLYGKLGSNHATLERVRQGGPYGKRRFHASWVRRSRMRTQDDIPPDSEIGKLFRPRS
jgi:hypothetical protein